MNTELTNSLNQLSVRSRNMLRRSLPPRISGIRAARKYVTDKLRDGSLHNAYQVGTKTRDELMTWAGIKPVRRVYGFAITHKCGHEVIQWNISLRQAEMMATKDCDGCNEN